MRSFILRFCAALSVAFLVACGGGGPFGKMITHRKAMLSIVEENKTDAAKAAAGLETYLKENEKALADLAVEMEAYQKEMGDDKEKMMKEAMNYASDIADMMKREQDLRKDAGDVWRDDRVRDAMRKVKGF